jgi:hypothetical protein
VTEIVQPQTRDDETVALAVGAGGALALVLGMIVDSGVLRVLGFVAAVAGGGFYARKKLAERSEKIDEAESAIRAELDELDPIAQAQVLKGLADSES